MPVSVVNSDSEPGAANCRHAKLWSIHAGVALVLLAPAGCSKTVRPGATYNVSIISKGSDGKPAPQGPATHVESVLVKNVQEITHEGHTFSLVVRKTQYGKATFDVIFPDKTNQMVQVRVGESRDILPITQKIGVRIELQESH